MHYFDTFSTGVRRGLRRRTSLFPTMKTKYFYFTLNRWMTTGDIIYSNPQPLYDTILVFSYANLCLKIKFWIKSSHIPAIAIIRKFVYITKENSELTIYCNHFYCWVFPVVIRTFFLLYWTHILLIAQNSDIGTNVNDDHNPIGKTKKGFSNLNLSRI